MRIFNILPIRRPPKTFPLDREDELDDATVTIYYLREEFLEAIPRCEGGRSVHLEQLREVLIVVYGSGGHRVTSLAEITFGMLTPFASSCMHIACIRLSMYVSRKSGGSSSGLDLTIRD